MSIGFSDLAGKMGPADAYAGWIDVTGAARVVDFSTDNQHNAKAADAVQNANNVSASFSNGMLSVTFVRALDTKACPT